MDLSSDSANQDVRCAVIVSSTILVSFCEFFWTDVNSIFVLRSSSPSAQTSSSITLDWCTLTNTMHHLTAIVEDMRKNSAADAFNFHMLGTTIANLKVVGADGVCVSQTNHCNNLCSFEGISTTVSEMRIVNVSSQPGEIKQASSLFSQRMVGSHIWGSNNHLSGSLLRDVNGGGSFLCSNCTFDWCHTTSSERPSIVRSTFPATQSHSFPSIHSISNQPEAESDPDDPYTEQTFDGVDRLTITDVAVTFTKCQFKNMKFTITDGSSQHAGGSAVYFTSSTNTESLVSCIFYNCSVIGSFPVYGGCIYMFQLTASINTVTECTFDDWFPGNDEVSPSKYGGAIGAFGTSAPIVISNSNFTLSGGTNTKTNGGFVSSYASLTPSSTTISNCRFVGNAKTPGCFMYIFSKADLPECFSVTDSLILNTNSDLVFVSIAFESLSGFTRTEFTNTSIRYSSASTTTLPHLFVDCTINQCSLYTWSSDVLFLFSGTSFTGKPKTTTKSTIHFFDGTHVVFHQCDFTNCSPPANRSLIEVEIDMLSLVVDTCSFAHCSGGKSIIHLRDTLSFFYFCSFTNVTGTTACVMVLGYEAFNFFESCRFYLLTANRLDIESTSSAEECLSDVAVTRCTSNRQMYFGTSWESRKQLMAVKVGSVATKNKFKVGTWPGDSFSSLPEALATLQPSSPLINSITFSDGNFTETTLLEVSQLVEIIGSGSNVSDSHSTQLTTNGIVSKSTGNLSLQSLRLVPLPSSVLASTEDDASLSVLNVIVENVQKVSANLFKLTSGSSEIRHSSFKNIESAESLVCVSQTSSLVITNSLFLSISRTILQPTPYETTQCASCIEGKTSGTVKLMYSRFGLCTTNGRAGAIDLEGDENSTVEMGYCYFDQNYAGSDVPNSSRGDDVVLKSFDESKTNLDMYTIESLASLFSFLIDSTHSIVHHPYSIDVRSTAADEPLGWSYPNRQVPISFLRKYPLQYLIEHRFRNTFPIHLTVDADYQETMTPFICQNAAVDVMLHGHSSIITVDQQNEVFITLQSADLSFYEVQFVFGELTTPAFTCDKYSSIRLGHTSLELANQTLTHPFIDSIDASVYVTDQHFLQPITLINTPFIRLINAKKSGTLHFMYTTPLLASPLTVPFVIGRPLIHEIDQAETEIDRSQFRRIYSGRCKTASLTEE
ncbi:hypothetical protein BLNAU_6598 [Blattamonas nauphoetae]|uniref:Uncharacterized protein n=1 Tax=Blattamonas nauphoetae TaxID=2049346 RepID=A0ABQ9Y3Q6_9EUKA|nr:hypothetical protein BLNAU_6598 [Blattamonas nauphoetae]